MLKFPLLSPRNWKNASISRGSVISSFRSLNNSSRNLYHPWLLFSSSVVLRYSTNSVPPAGPARSVRGGLPCQKTPLTLEANGTLEAKGGATIVTDLHLHMNV